MHNGMKRMTFSACVCFVYIEDYYSNTVLLKSYLLQPKPGEKRGGRARDTGKEKVRE